MKFDKIIKKSYFLLEQDEQGNMPPTPSVGGQGAPSSSGDAKVAVAGLEKVGKKMGDQIENAEDELFTMSKNLIKVFNQVLKVDNIDLNDHPNLKQILDKLKLAKLNIENKYPNINNKDSKLKFEDFDLSQPLFEDLLIKYNMSPALLKRLDWGYITQRI